MIKRPSRLPILIVTGASGIIGSHFLDTCKDDYYIYAIARRSQLISNVPIHHNVKWIQLDVGDKDMVDKTIDNIISAGGADFIIHLAGYYDFDNEDSPEFHRTNVLGTLHMLQGAEKLKIKRFIFSSSLTVSKFNDADTIIDESSPADADFPYAVSKKEAEELIMQYSEKFPCAIMRLAAIFSDWCEYGPLYMFLMTWLTRNWKSRVLAGKGVSAVPYLHVKNLNTFILSIMQHSKRLPACPILIASPDGCTTHNELYNIAIRYNYHREPKPIFMPLWLASIGVFIFDIWGKIIGKRPFEKPWMMKYIDKKLEVDAAKSREMLQWKPVNRFHIGRRLLFLIESMKSNPYEWDYKNFEAMYKSARTRPNLKIYETMLKNEKEIIENIIVEVNSPESTQFKTYQTLSKEVLFSRFEFLYQMIKNAVRTGDRVHMLSYGKDLAAKRFIEGFWAKEVTMAVEKIGDFVVQYLIDQPELKGMETRVKDEILMTVQLLLDEIEDSFEQLTGFSE